NYEHQNLHSFPTRRSSDLRIARTLGRSNSLREVSSSENNRREDLTSVSSPGLEKLSLLELEVRAGLSRVEVRDGVAAASSCLQEDRKSTRLNSSHVAISYA